jgi:hypothetical protein
LRCSSCNARVPGKKLKESGGRCTGCGHAVGVVSDGGKLLYTRRHVAFELIRRAAKRRRRQVPLMITAAAILIVAAILAFKFSLLILVPGCVVAALVAARALNLGRHGDLFALMAQWERVNPPAAAVPSREELVERERMRDLSGLRSAPRLLLCEYASDCAFLIANDFHLHHACPVAGADGAGLDGFPELKQRLERPGKLDIFTLHGLTPAGKGFASRIASLPEVRARREPATLIDMGLGAVHAPALKDIGTELSAVRPALLLAAAGRSIAERAPMRLGKGKDKDDDEDIHGDDSE